MKTVIVMLLLWVVTPVSVCGKPTNHELDNAYPSLRDKVDWIGFDIQLTMSSVKYDIKALIQEYLDNPQTEDTLTQLMKGIREYLVGLLKLKTITSARIDIDKDSFVEKGIMSLTVTFGVPGLADKDCQMTFGFPVIWDEPLKTETGL